MLISDACYVKSAPTLDYSPNTNRLPEFAFIGRSNVGKSSLINYLCNKKKLAHVSASPGKTIYLNYYFINQSHYWVDLPGYGFAKVAQAQREEWHHAWNHFLRGNKNLRHVFLLIDSRVAIQAIDIQMIQQLLACGVGWSIVFTKSEKQKNSTLEQHIIDLEKQLAPLPQRIKCFITSASKKQGRESVLLHLNEILKDP